MTIPRRRGDHPPLTQISTENPGCFFFEVGFPVEAPATRHAEPTYGWQTHIRMPLSFCTDLGLDGDWGFRFQTPSQLAVFVVVDSGRPQTLALPEMEIFWPDQLGARQRLVINGGMALALLELKQDVDLSKRSGRITMMLLGVDLLESLR
jgi:hypothetical protein